MNFKNTYKQQNLKRMRQKCINLEMTTFEQLSNSYFHTKTPQKHHFSPLPPPPPGHQGTILTKLHGNWFQLGLEENIN